MEVAGVFSGKLGSSSSSKVAFLFTRHGSQYVNMGRQLYEQAGVFREAINQCAQILSSLLESSLIEILYPADTDDNDLSLASTEASLLNQTVYTQPALFVIEYALAKLWQSWGIKPDAVMGHHIV